MSGQQGYPPPGYGPQGYPPPGYPPPGYAFPPGNVKKGMAITSFVLALLSLFTCGGLLVLPIVALVLGIIAYNRANKQPMLFGGKGLALAGIIISVVAPFQSIVAAIAIPNLIKSRQAANEASAIGTVRTIGNAQAAYQAKNGKFADLATLGATGLIDSVTASGQKSGYLFTSVPLSVPGGPDMYDTTAIPITAGTFGTGDLSFGSNETYVIYKANGYVVLKGTPEDRAPVGGTAISRNLGRYGPLYAVSGSAPFVPDF